MDADFLVILAIAFGVVGVVFTLIAITNRCPACGSSATVLSRIELGIVRQVMPTSFVGRAAISS